MMFVAIAMQAAGAVGLVAGLVLLVSTSPRGDQ